MGVLQTLVYRPGGTILKFGIPTLDSRVCLSIQQTAIVWILQSNYLLRGAIFAPSRCWHRPTGEVQTKKCRLSNAFRRTQMFSSVGGVISPPPTAFNSAGAGKAAIDDQNCPSTPPARHGSPAGSGRGTNRKRELNIRFLDSGRGGGFSRAPPSCCASRQGQNANWHGSGPTPERNCQVERRQKQQRARLAADSPGGAWHECAKHGGAGRAWVRGTAGNYMWECRSPRDACRFSWNNRGGIGVNVVICCGLKFPTGCSPLGCRC